MIAWLNETTDSEYLDKIKVHCMSLVSFSDNFAQISL